MCEIEYLHQSYFMFHNDFFFNFINCSTNNQLKINYKKDRFKFNDNDNKLIFNTTFYLETD